MALCFDKGFHPKVVALNMASDHRYYMSSMFNLYMHASLPIDDNQSFLIKPNRFGSKNYFTTLVRCTVLFVLFKNISHFQLNFM